MSTSRLQRAVLLAPDAVARRAADLVDGPQERWMLRQARAVRRSYVDEVLDRDAEELRAQVWMLRQADEVRAGYVREVLLPRLAAGRAAAAEG